MGREIKFRQWDGEKFHYWGFINGGFIHPFSVNLPSDQFIGKKDDKGKEIYERDKLVWSDGYRHNDFITEVSYSEDKGAFVAKGRLIEDFDSGGATTYRFKVIGNSYQPTPEGGDEAEGGGE